MTSKVLRLVLAIGCVSAAVGCASEQRAKEPTPPAECAKPSDACVQKATGLLKTQPKEAVRIFTEACDANVARGCAELGNAYSEGGVLPQDGTRADGAYEKACRLDPSWCD